MTEREWQYRMITTAAELGWQWLHIGQTKGRRNQGVRGTLFKGFPDLMLVKGGRMVFVELKTQDAPPPTAQQKQTLHLLSQAAEVYVWRPSDFGQALDTLAV